MTKSTKVIATLSIELEFEFHGVYTPGNFGETEPEIDYQVSKLGEVSYDRATRRHFTKWFNLTAVQLAAIQEIVETNLDNEAMNVVAEFGETGE